MEAVRMMLRARRCAALGLVLTGLLVLPAGSQAAPGDLDKDFGTNGLVVTDLSGPLYAEDYAGDVVTDPSGRIVVAGRSEYNGQTASDAIVLRYTPSGALDPSFGSGGVVRLHFGAFDHLAGVAIDTSGRIVVAGGTASDISCTTYCHPVVARLTENGQLDPTFSGDGVVTITGDPYERRASSVTIDPDSRILVACGPSVYRLTSAGGFDSTFGNSGRAPVEEAYYDITVDSAGRIAVAGDYGVKRLLSNGQPDTTFGPYDGISAAEDPIPGSTDFVYAVAVDSSDRVIAGGISHSFEPGNPIHNQPFLVRYTPSGLLDSSFSGDGVILGSEEGLITDLLVDSTGRYLATGYSNELYTEGSVVIRYLSDGSLDPAFGGGSGFAPVLFHTGDLAIDPSQRIVVTGTGPEDVDVAVARYFGDITPPPEPPPGEPSSPVSPATAPVSVPAPAGPATKKRVTRPRSTPKRCRKGFKKRRVRGKTRCVKKKTRPKKHARGGRR